MDFNAGQSCINHSQCNDPNISAENSIRFVTSYALLKSTKYRFIYVSSWTHLLEAFQALTHGMHVIIQLGKDVMFRSKVWKYFLHFSRTTLRRSWRIWRLAKWRVFLSCRPSISTKNLVLSTVLWHYERVRWNTINFQESEPSRFRNVIDRFYIYCNVRRSDMCRQ